MQRLRSIFFVITMDIDDMSVTGGIQALKSVIDLGTSPVHADAADKALRETLRRALAILEDVSTVEVENPKSQSQT